MAELGDEFPCTITNWEFIYGLCRDVAAAVRGEYELDDVRRLLRESHGIERIQREVAQPNRLGEVLAEMARLDVIVDAGDGE